MKRIEVKYGDVSFIVEGFDDPAEVMEAITACLRELRANPGPAGGLDAETMRHVMDRLRAERLLSGSEPPEDRVEVSPEPQVVEPPPPPPIMEPEEPAPEDGRARPAAPPVDEPTLQRILDWANQHLSTPDAARRRESIASQKAAVAATEAERRMARSVNSRIPPTDPFRRDLRDAIDSDDDDAP